MRDFAVNNSSHPTATVIFVAAGTLAAAVAVIALATLFTQNATWSQAGQFVTGEARQVFLGLGLLEGVSLVTFAITTGLKIQQRMAEKRLIENEIGKDIDDHLKDAHSQMGEVADAESSMSSQESVAQLSLEDSKTKPESVGTLSSQGPSEGHYLSSECIFMEEKSASTSVGKSPELTSEKKMESSNSDDVKSVNPLMKEASVFPEPPPKIKPSKEEVSESESVVVSEIQNAPDTPVPNTLESFKKLGETFLNFIERHGVKIALKDKENLLNSLSEMGIIAGTFAKYPSELKTPEPSRIGKMISGYIGEDYKKWEAENAGVLIAVISLYSKPLTPDIARKRVEKAASAAKSYIELFKILINSGKLPFSSLIKSFLSVDTITKQTVSSLAKTGFKREVLTTAEPVIKKCVAGLYPLISNVGFSKKSPTREALDIFLNDPQTGGKHLKTLERIAANKEKKNAEELLKDLADTIDALCADLDKIQPLPPLLKKKK